MDNKEILDEIIEEFKALTRIPRKSGHEEKVAKYLKDRCLELGLNATLDNAWNVIAEKKVNDDSFIILQAHEDMVCVADDGATYDPLCDAIETVIEDNYIRAHKTSLGADDGIGIAIAIVLAKHLDKNIRLIFTSDEEVGMHGAESLDAKHLDGKFLINIDWEEADTICNSCAGGRNVVCTKKSSGNIVDFSESERNKILEISIDNLPGGHSGTEIDKGITNAINKVAETLKGLIDRGVRIKLVSFDGGFASNAICASSRAVIACPISQVTYMYDEFSKIKMTTKDGDKIQIENLDSSDKSYFSLSEDETKELVSFLSGVISGVNTMSSSIEGLVESSANIGKIETILNDDNSITINAYALLRSCTLDKMNEVFDNYVTKANENNLSIIISSDSPMWPIKEDSLLRERCLNIYRKQNDKNIKVVAVHAGLECGEFASKNPNLDMISVGPTITGAHSPKEKVYLDTITIIYNLIREVIEIS